MIPDISSATNSPRFSIWVSVLSASIVRFSGATRTGEVVSTTVMVWVAEAELPEESVAVQVTIVSPSGNTSGASLVNSVFWMSIISGNSNGMFVPPKIVASNVSSEIKISGIIVSTKVIV